MRCRFERTIFSSEENGYTVAVFSCGGVTLPDGQNVSLFTAVGYHLPDTAAVEFEFEGNWKNNAKFGYQFEVENFVEIVPKTEAGIEAYLSCGLIKGIGKGLAKTIVRAFGVETLNIMDHEPEKLKTIPRMGEKRYRKVMDSYTAYRGARDVVTFLAPYEIAPGKAVRIYNGMGKDALQEIRKNPYVLEQFGIGFPISDKIALSIGFDPHAYLRICAGTLYTLHEYMARYGHLYAEKPYLAQLGSKALHTHSEAITTEEVGHAIDDQIAAGTLRAEKDCVYLREVYLSERGAARDILRLMHARLRISVPDNLNAELRKTEAQLKIQYSPEQEDAIRTCFSKSLNIIVGYPGTGKTTVIRGILDIVHRLNKDPEVLLCSPTGRAARRMSEATGLPAMTIHKALGIRGDDYDDCVDSLSADAVIVDELSMLDMKLAALLLSKIRAGAKVILLGDPDQLPSVGPGAVLSELLRSGKVPCTVLTTIFRQADTSSIVLNAKQIREGKTMLRFRDDFVHIDAGSCDEAADVIRKLFCEEVKAHGLEEVQVLTPLRKKTSAGAETLNDALQEAVNPQDGSKLEVKSRGHVIRVGDKVMHLRNTDMDGTEVNNGDIGFVERIGKIEGETVLSVDFGDGRHAVYEGDDLDMLALAYATTIHKSQGSEYDVVILTLSGAPNIMLKRNLVYTAITRAKKKLVFVGKLSTLALSIRNVDTSKRNTLLADRIVSVVQKIQAREIPEQMTLGKSA